MATEPSGIHGTPEILQPAWPDPVLLEIVHVAANSPIQLFLTVPIDPLIQLTLEPALNDPARATTLL